MKQENIKNVEIPEKSFNANLRKILIKCISLHNEDMKEPCKGAGCELCDIYRNILTVRINWMWLNLNYKSNSLK